MTLTSGAWRWTWVMTFARIFSAVWATGTPLLLLRVLLGLEPDGYALSSDPVLPGGIGPWPWLP